MRPYTAGCSVARRRKCSIPLIWCNESSDELHYFVCTCGMGCRSTIRCCRKHRLLQCADTFLSLAQERVGLPCICCFFETFLCVGIVWGLPYVEDFCVGGGLLGAGFPKFVHHRGIDLWFLPLYIWVYASAASIYDDDEMLCSHLGQAYPEIIEVTIR